MRRILIGVPADQAVSPGTLANPHELDYSVAVAARRAANAEHRSAATERASSPAASHEAPITRFDRRTERIRASTDASYAQQACQRIPAMKPRPATSNT